MKLRTKRQKLSLDGTMKTGLHMKRKIRFILLYFASASLLGFLSVLPLAFYIENADIINKTNILTKMTDIFQETSKKVSTAMLQLSGRYTLIEYSLTEEIALSFPAWVANNNPNLPLQGIYIGNHRYESLTQASSMLKNGDTLIIGSGIYTQPIVIRADDISVIGNGHVVIEKTAAEGKGAIITKGDNTTITNIECRNIQVADDNGACIRHEGTNLTLKNVYFHNSEQGVLTGEKPGSVVIEGSRFEQLGKNGQAHGIYIGGGELIINNSLFLAAKSEGHEIKSRAATTRITASTIASLSSIDSRLIDIPNGGVLEIFDSILEQGPNSANQDMIGYELERSTHHINKIDLQNNIIILERNGTNILLNQKNKDTDSVIKNNIIISDTESELEKFNLLIKTRNDAGLQSYPSLPKNKEK